MEQMNPRLILANLTELFGSKGLILDVGEHTFFDGTDQAVKNSKPDAYLYRLIGKETMGTVSISNTLKYSIHGEEILTLHVRDIDVPEEHRGKGIARAILLYGLCHSMVQCPKIQFSDLEDCTPFANDPARNLYHEFGFRFKEGDPEEKMMDLGAFQQNEMQTLFTKVMSTFLQAPTRGRSKSQNKTQNKTQNKSRSQSKNKPSRRSQRKKS
jgi:GNAT superfamily N-acetyltransferase